MRPTSPKAASKSQYYQKYREDILRKNKEYREKNIDKIRARIQKNRENPVTWQLIQRQGYEHNLKYNYGIEPEDVARMLHAQENKCACCRRKFEVSKHIHVDHCHSTGAIRGMLCHWCNVAVGVVDESPERAEAVLNYVKLIVKGRL